MVAAELAKTAGVSTEVVRIATLGDKKQGTVAAKVADKKEWILEHERALLANQIDLAVHCSKDVPIEIEAGTVLLPVLEREMPYDVCVLSLSLARTGISGLHQLPGGARIGTCSVRRAAELRRLRPDLEIVELRGNVTTRLKKLDAEWGAHGADAGGYREGVDVEAAVLAGAGLLRLGLGERIAWSFSPEQLLPGVNQGTLVAQCRADDSATVALLQALVNPIQEQCWAAERAVIERLGADCNSAVGVLALPVGGQMDLALRVLSHDGQQSVEARHSGEFHCGAKLGVELAEKAIAGGALELLRF